MGKYVFYLFMTFTFLTNVIAQSESSTISGFVIDQETGEGLIGANIFIPELGTGASSNSYGFYSLTLSKGKYSLKFSYVGYTSKIFEVDLNASQKLNVGLNPSSIETEEVVIEAQRGNYNVKSVEMGTSNIIIKEIQNIPILLGEQDILKTIQLMPGVSPAGEGNSGFFVRGGKSDQNLILLDEASVYNPSHLLGFFSVFNSDAIKSAKLIKGNMPAEYGGRISSVLDIFMKEGNSREYKFNGGIGLISSRLTIEGPIKKDKSSFLISGRRTYADLALKLSSDEQLSSSELYFYDLNLKANYSFGDNDRIFLSGYMGRDVLGFRDRFGFDWGNITSTLRWNHIFSDKLFANSSLIYSDYNYAISVTSGDRLIEIRSGIKDWNLKSDFQYFLNSENKLRFGFSGFYHTFSPGEVLVNGDVNFNSKKIHENYAFESGVYFSHEYDLNARLKFQYGIRYSNFTIVGPTEVYNYDIESNPVDTTVYNSGDIIKSYGGLEPRFASTFLIDESKSIKFAYARNYQYVHLLSTSTTSTPLDIWQPSSSIVEPEIADQVSAGYFQNFDNNNYEASVEVYYKNMKNQIDYKNGADILLNEYAESQLVFGRGWSYGLELSLKKNYGNFTGWLSYTLSKSERQFAKINNGLAYPARQDRTHDFSITGVYKLNNDWTISANWIYYTGDAVTFPSGKYDIEGTTINLYSGRNAHRMPDYHRMDLGANYILSKDKDSEMSLSFSIYNVYGRKNAYSITFEESEVNPQQTEAVRLALFSIVPSISFNFKF